MKIKIKRFDKLIPLPERKSKGAVGADLYTREKVVILTGGIGYLKLNVAMKIPKSHWGMLVARSSTHKMGLMPVNGFGVMDSDYCGDEDEWILAVLNITENDVVVESGTRIAQMILVKKINFDFEEVSRLDKKSRGGFGSTGKK